MPHESVLAPLRLLPLLGAPPLPLTRYMPRLRKTLEAEERFWVTTGLGKTWIGLGLGLGLGLGGRVRVRVRVRWGRGWGWGRLTLTLTKGWARPRRHGCCCPSEGAA